MKKDWLGWTDDSFKLVIVLWDVGMESSTRANLVELDESELNVWSNMYCAIFNCCKCDRLLFMVIALKVEWCWNYINMVYLLDK